MTRLMLFAILIHAVCAEEKLAVVDGYAFVQVRVNGKGPFRMLVDTGASSCTLSNEAATAAGLVYDHRVMVATAAGEHVLPAAGETRVQAGTVQASGVEMLAGPIDAVRQVDPNADGILGQSFLGRFPYLIDYRKKRLMIGGEAEEQSVVLGGTLAADQVDGRIVVPVSFGGGGKSWRLVLDSGSRRLVLECGTGCPRIERTGTGEMVTNAGRRDVEVGVAKRIEVGEIAIARAEALLVRNASDAGREEGLLPTHLFSTVYVDARRGQVRLGR